MLANLFHIQKILSSDIYLETGYYDSYFVVFLYASKHMPVLQWLPSYFGAQTTLIHIYSMSYLLLSISVLYLVLQ